MEDELGVTLFVRNHSVIKLTLAGERISKHVEKMLNEYHLLQLSVKDYIKNYSQKLKIASFFDMAIYGITDLIVAFEKNRVNFHVESQECDHARMIHLLDTRQTDLIIGYREFFPQGEEYHSFPLVKDKLVLVANKNHPVAAYQTISLEDVENERFCFPREDSSLFNFYYDTCRDSGFVPKLTLSDVRLGTIKRYISEGLRVTLQMHSCASNFFHEPKFRLIDIQESPTLTLTILTKDFLLSDIVREFIQFAESYYGIDLSCEQQDVLSPQND